MKKLLLVLLLSTVAFAQIQIAVLNFQGKNVPPEEASALTDRLGIEMYRTGKFTVIEREKLDDILQEQEFQLDDCTTDECIVQIGELAQVEQVVAGSISRVGTVYSIAARIISVESGHIINTAIYDTEGNIGMLLKSGMREVAAQLANQHQPSTSNEPVVQQPQVSQEQVKEEPVTTEPAQQKSQITRTTKPTQTRNEFPKRMIGGYFGGVSSMIYGNDVEMGSIEPVGGTDVGFLYAFNVLPRAFIRLEILITKKGYIENNTDDIFRSIAENQVEYKYIEFPFLLHYQFSGKKLKPYIVFGASAGILTSFSAKALSGGVEYESTNTKPDNMKSGESVYIFGGGTTIGKSFFLEAKYNMGVTNILTDIRDEDMDVKNMSFSIDFGYLFKK